MNRYLTIFLACFVIVAGCSENRPLDLILSEATRPTSETVSDAAVCYKALGIDDTNQEYTLIFDKPCIDAIFTGDQSGGVPTDLPAGVTPTEMTTIVESVADGSDAYLKAWVYVQGTVIEDLTGGGRSLLLQTDNDQVKFRVSSFVKKSQLARWTKGNPYGFILLITGIQTNAEGITTIFSRVDDPDNIKNGRSLFTPSPSPVLAADIDVMLDSLRKGESYYIGKRVSFLTSVKLRNDNSTSEATGTSYDNLVVYIENVPLFATGRDYVSIYQTMKLFEGNIDAKYSKGSFHNFEVTIHYLSGENFFNPDKVSIVGYFEETTFLPILTPANTTE